MSKRENAATGLVLFLGGIGAMPALAQAPAESHAGATLQEVVVTAQFREQRLQDTPIAITALSSEMLDARNQTNITEVTANAPNVTLTPAGAGFGSSATASIRGVGQADFN